MSNYHKRLNRFASWISATPDLSSLHGNRNAILAVAQHYGIRTPFLDFSTSPIVAGFFATDGAKKGDRGTIICINRARFENSWRDMNERFVKSDGYPLTEIIDIDVKNLWRLQAQQGLFIRSHVDSTMLEMFSYMLHIYFPQNGSSVGVANEDIYPISKSHLEVLLDQYFLIDSYPDRNRRMEEMFGPPVYSASETDISAYVAKYYADGKIPPRHESWSSEFARAWLIEPDERHTDIGPRRTAEIFISRDWSISEFGENVRNSFSSEIKKLNGTRDHVHWNIIFKDGDEVYIDGSGEPTEELDDDNPFKMGMMVNAIYDGMRYLPYEDTQIVEAISRYAIFVFFGCYEAIDNCEGVEFSGGNIRGRGFCNGELLMSAARPDFFDLICSSKLNNKDAMDFRDFAFAASHVKSSYVFEKFLDIFVTDLIPSQAAVAVEGLVIGVNPMRIDILGES